MRGLILSAAALVATGAAIPPPPRPSGPSEAPPAAGDRPTRRGEWLDKFPGPEAGFMLRMQSLCGGARYEGRSENGTRLVLGPARCALADGRLLAIDLPVTDEDGAETVLRIATTASGLSLSSARTEFGAENEEGGTFTRQVFSMDSDARAIEIVPGERFGVRRSGPQDTDARFDLARPLPG